MDRYHRLYAGTAMLIAAVILRTVWDGSYELVILAVVGVFVIVTSYDEGEKEK